MNFFLLDLVINFCHSVKSNTKTNTVIKSVFLDYVSETVVSIAKWCILANAHFKGKTTYCAPVCRLLNIQSYMMKAVFHFMKQHENVLVQRNKNSK